MNKKKSIEYWLKSAEDDWKVTYHLFEKKDYAYALFFAHLTIEKILKAIYIEVLNEIPPYTHRLIYLVEKIEKLYLTGEQLELLETITDFNMEARYPDEKFAFKKKCTKEFAKKYINQIGVLRKWLLQKIQ